MNLLIALVLSAAAANLNATDETLTATTTTAVATDVTVNYVDFTTSSGANVGSGEQVTNFASATTTAILAAPAASTTRTPSFIRVCNKGTTAQTVTVQYAKTAGSLSVRQFSASLGASECSTWGNDGQGSMIQANGVPRVTADPPGFSGRVLSFSLAATAFDTIGYHYAYGKDVGFPGAYTLGTPGVNGAVTDCSTAAGALIVGTHVLSDPTSGGWYLTRFGAVGAVPVTLELSDLVWYNTGLVVTTGAQAITTPTFPARDINGSSNGEGYRIAIYATAALGNAAAVATTTVTYVNSNGDTGRTASLFGAVGFQFPATPVIGTWVPFNLQAGDTGVRSISSINTGTTLTSGSFSLMVYRPIAMDGVTLANYPSGSLSNRQALNPGVRIWNRTCFWRAAYGAVAVTAPSLYNGTIELMER